MYDEQRFRQLPTPSLYCVSLVGRLIYCFASNFGMICISILINIVWRICIHILSQQFYCPCVFSPFLDTHTNSWRIIDDTTLSGVLMGSREWVEGMKVARWLPWIVDCFFLNINRRWRRSSGSGLRWKRNSSPGKPVSCIINHLLLLFTSWFEWRLFWISLSTELRWQRKLIWKYWNWMHTLLSAF